jgi:hypothetical protein
MTPPTQSAQRVFPPVMRRGLYLYLGLCCLFALAAIGWVILRNPMGVPRGWAYRYGAMIPGFMPLLVFMPLWFLRTRHIRLALHEAQGRLCTHCAYDVSRLPPSGTCPECGHHYDIEKDKPLWQAIGASLPDSTPPGSGPQPPPPETVRPPA